MSGIATASAVVVPPGYSQPFFKVTDTDHTAWIVIATSLCLCWILLFAAIRVFVRRTITPGFGPDDALLAASTLLSIIQSSILLGACSDGLGQSVELIPTDMVEKVQKMYYISNILLMMALGLSKISVVFFLLRLAVVKEQRLVFYTVAGFTAAWMVGSTFAVALQCNIGHPWIIVDEKCSGAFTRWKVIGAFDIILEVAIVLLAVHLVWDLYTTKSKKIVVVTAFGFRLGMIVPIAFRLANFDKPDRVSNPILAEAIFIVWTQTELCYSLISATIPSLRTFVINLNTQFGGLGADESDYGYGHGSSSYSKNTFPLSKTGLDVNNTNNIGERHPPGLGEESSKAAPASIGSNDSQRMIIRKDITDTVHAA